MCFLSVVFILIASLPLNRERLLDWFYYVAHNVQILYIVDYVHEFIFSSFGLFSSLVFDCLFSN